MGSIKVYTREETAEYPKGLALSVHIAVGMDKKEPAPLNKNCGILYASAAVRENDTLAERFVKEPQLLKLGEGEYGVTAKWIDADGNEPAPGKRLLWETTDFISFDECEMICASEIADAKEEMEIPDDLAAKAGDAWEKHTNAVDHIVFPLAPGFADPVIFRWKNAWYFIATNDNLDDVGLYVRKADTVESLFAENVTESCILPYDEKRDLLQTFWAPEFHVIGGELYLLFAVGGKEWGPQCHMMHLKPGGEILNADDWEDPVKVVRRDGSALWEGGISLDMTYLSAGGKSYLVWSARQKIFTEEDTGSMLYIATVDEKKPWILTGEPVRLARPLYGWENMQGTINNEGPFALVAGDTVYLAYSGGAAGGDSYAVGCMTAFAGADLCDPKNWKKCPAPVLSSYLAEGVYGPGHNAFFKDEKGELYMTFHGQTACDRKKRCTAVARVRTDEKGSPVWVKNVVVNPFNTGYNIEKH